MRRSRALTLLAGAAFGAAGARAVAQTNAPIRIATIPIEPGIEVYFAQDMGFFAKAGLDAVISQLPGGPAIAAALVSGAVDVGFVALDALAEIHQRGIPVVAVAPGTEYLAPFTTQAAALVVPPNSTVEKAPDLNGKTIAVISLNGLTHTAVCTWIDKNGGDSSTVKFVEMPPPAMVAALAANRIDAAQVAEPFVGAARKAGRVLTYGFESVAKDFLTTAWCAAAPWAREHPSLVSGFVAAMRETAAWANANPKQSGAILTNYLKLDPAVVASMTRVRYANQLVPALMQPLVDVTARYGGFPTFPARELMFGA
ncbi:MAG: ABC transporter substrate-binding protein [Candidatus Lustribacter sp.]